MNSSNIEVSVICLAYNHEKYIGKALDGIINQKTRFSFEIVIHDDQSSDGTTEIIKKYEKKYSDLIKPIYENENQYSQGRDVFMDLSLPHAKGRYIAICEGDDYWTDDEKLQKQYDIMEAHPELDMCACGAIEISGFDGSELHDIRPKKKDAVLTIEEVILGGGRYLATASLFFRKSIFGSLMEFEKVICFDYTYQIKGALRGGIFYLDNKMAVYRKAAEGSWSMRVEKDKEKRSAHVNKEVNMLRTLDKETGGKFHAIIEKRITAYTSFFDQLMMHAEEFASEISGIADEICTSYLWGLGVRGDAFQEFCKHEKIKLDGVCDMKNICVGEYTSYGYQVFDSDYVFHNSDVIFASNYDIYNALVKEGYSGILIDIQKYMPLS